MRLLLLASLFLATLSFAPRCLASNLIPIEKLFYKHEKFSEQLSPTGDYLSYLSAGEDAAQELIIEHLDDDRKPSPLSHAAPSYKVNVYFWLSDSIIVWEEQSLQKKSKQWFIHDLHTKTTRRLLAQEKRHTEIIGVSTGKSPALLLGISEQPSAFPDVYRFDIIHEKLSFIRHNTEKISHWVLNADGSPLAGLRWTSDGGKEILRFHPRSEVIQRFQVHDTVQIHSTSQDGKNLVLLNDADSDTLQAYRLELSTKKQTSISSAQPYDLSQILFYKNTTEPFLLLWEQEKPHYEAHTPAAKELVQLCDWKFGTGNWRYIGSDQNQQKHLISEYSDREAGRLYLYHTQSQKIQLLWVNNTTIKKKDLCPTQTILYTSKDGTSINAYWTPPKGKPPYPTIIFPHGGPRMRTYWGYDMRVQFLASRGYAVLQPNFRGSRGFGKAFMNAGDQEWGTGIMQQDISDGVRHLTATGLADPKRIAIMGGSYGGFTTLAGLCFTPELYAAGVCLFGASDLTTAQDEMPLEWEAYRGEQNTRVGNPNSPEGMAKLKSQSPLFHAFHIQAPLFLYHGKQDQLIPFSQATRFIQALANNKKPYEFYSFEDEAHGFSSMESEIAVYLKIEEFLAQHLNIQEKTLQESYKPAIKKRLKSLIKTYIPIKNKKYTDLTSSDN